MCIGRTKDLIEELADTRWTEMCVAVVASHLVSGPDNNRFLEGTLPILLSIVLNIAKY